MHYLRGLEQLRVSVGWTAGSATENGSPMLDLIAPMTDGDRRARSDDDIVFYKQRPTPDGSVVHNGQTESVNGGRDDLSVDMTALTDDVASVVIAAGATTSPKMTHNESATAHPAWATNVLYCRSPPKSDW